MEFKDKISWNLVSRYQNLSRDFVMTNDPENRVVISEK